MSEELAAIKHRLARLEAKEAILSAFNRYLYSLDTGFGDDILDCYTEDAVLEVPNFPGAAGQDLHFEGRSEIAPLYAPYAERESQIGGGHHSANVAINVANNLKTAQVSAYFMTSTANGVQGGRYEGVMCVGADTVWRWHTLSIISAWGWTATNYETVSQPVALSYSPMSGRHAAYEVTEGGSGN
ncbi:MAG: nuclear transport factor 2 family protein [Pseudomonadales bacterium]